MSNAMTNMTLPMHNSSQEVQQLKAKVALLERKIRMKDQLFDDSLSSSFAGCNGSQGTEYQTLIQKLKKKVLFLQTKNDQSEAEIKRLTKTVRVVEVEVQEDTQPLKSELQKLQDLNSKLLS
jgi:transcription antitermination factor NusA-like protein